jgi:hypothetical protein
MIFLTSFEIKMLKILHPVKIIHNLFYSLENVSNFFEFLLQPFWSIILRFYILLFNQKEILLSGG